MDCLVRRRVRVGPGASLPTIWRSIRDRADLDLEPRAEQQLVGLQTAETGTFRHVRSKHGAYEFLGPPRPVAAPCRRHQEQLKAGLSSSI